MAKLQITQIKSDIAGTQSQRQTLRSLGLRKIGDVSVKEDKPEFRGMVRTVAHLIRVEEVN
ncbi:MAG: 50S ribosomal protein L30 [Actinobacteria bacterium]|nr:50S ribosomal protein L30 [Actinomycetota bacterium]